MPASTPNAFCSLSRRPHLGSDSFGFYAGLKVDTTAQGTWSSARGVVDFLAMVVRWRIAVRISSCGHLTESVKMRRFCIGVLNFCLSTAQLYQCEILAKRTLVTSTLPYANGPRMGHLGAYLTVISTCVTTTMSSRYLVHLWFRRAWCTHYAGRKKEGVHPKDIADRSCYLGKAFDGLGISFDIMGVHRVSCITKQAESSSRSWPRMMPSLRKQTSSCMIQRRSCFWRIGLCEAHARIVDTRMHTVTNARIAGRPSAQLS